MKKISRRDILKSMATMPVLGYFANRFYVKYQTDIKTEAGLKPEFLRSINTPSDVPSFSLSSQGDLVRIGVVGNGMRGPQIFRALGYASDEWAEKQMKGGKHSTQLQSFLQQDDLNIEITGVCDTYHNRAEAAARIAATKYRAGQAKAGKLPKIYGTYREMLADDQLDAIVILTPDHWHAKMAMDAAHAGKHVYLEKPMCQTFAEAKALREVVRHTGIILQVGHQNRQQASYIKAREIYQKGLLGQVSMIETFTNRNDDHGAWIREIPENARVSNVNWQEFLGDKPWHEFDLDRYFNWQKWFEYGTGPAGNQFTHEFDCINQILDLGIPDKVVATGGNYYFKDPRDIPDVFNAVFEYKKKGCCLTYDCTLRNSKLRDKTILGQDATMEVNVGVALYPDRRSDRYQELDHDKPMYTYHPKLDAVDAVTSATAKYYHERGFGYTYHQGKRIDATYLHMKEWLHAIQNQRQPSCNVDKGFEETATFYMANLAYLENRTVQWEYEKEEIS